MEKIGVKILTIVLLLFIFFSAFGQTQFNFEQFTVEDGLARNNIHAIYRDHLGYIWIGTVEGLNKFDGANMYSYFRNPNSENSLPDDNIGFIVEDDSLNLWVGTDRGLVLYNRIKDEFTKIDLDIDGADLISFCKLKGQMVFGTTRGIVIYNCETKIFQFEPFKQIDSSLSSNQLLSFSDDEIIIASFNAGLWKYNLSTKKFAPFGKEQIRGVERIIQDESGVIWLTTKHNGLQLFDNEGVEIVDSFVNKIIDPKYHFVRDMVVRDGSVWISTDGTGLFVIDRKMQSVRHIQERKGDENSLPTNSLTDLFVDDFGNILVGSVRSGIIWIHEGYIQSYTDVVEGNPYGLSNSNVICVFEDHNGGIWIGTDGGGLNLFDPNTNRFEHINEFKKAKIVSICSFEKDKLLVSSYRDEFRIFDINRKKFINSNEYDWLIAQSESNLQIPIILKKDQRGRIWKLSGKTSIIGLDGSVELVNASNGWDGQLSGNGNCLQIVNEEELLVGSLNRVSKVNLNDKTIKSVLSLKDQKWWNGKRNNYIYSFAKDGDLIWISSSLGVFSYHCKTNQVKHHPSNLFKTTHCIATGNNNTLWIGSARGLYRYIPEKENYQLFGRAEGVRGFEYINRSVLKTRNGDVYMGAVEGLVKISADEEFGEDNLNQQISFANIMADGAALCNSEHCDEKGIQLAWDNTSLEFNIVVNEKSLFRKRIFRLLLEGYDKEITETTESQITFSHLPAGKYTLKVWCNQADGTWLDKCTSLKVIVPLPWWKKWWFIWGIIISIVLVFLIIIDIGKKRSTLTMELQIERERRNQVKLLNEQKLVFFTNISHELRTPLSLLYGPLNLLVNEKNYSGEKVRENIFMMYRQAQKMKRLIDQVMDMRKIEAGKDEVILTSIMIVNWLEEFLSQYEFELSDKKISLVRDLPNEIQVACDVEKLDKILSNLLSNAIKYSPNGGNIIITFKIDKDRLLFSLADEGKGITEEDIPKVFDRFFQAENHKAGSGIGLSFVRQLVEFQGGEIWVNSRENRGVEFEFYLPLKQQDILSGVLNYDAPDILSGEVDFSEEQSLDFLRNTKLLVVEDDPELRKFIKEGLSNYASVIEAENGEEAWDLVLSESPDLIVSDVMMPVMDGFSLCRKIREDAKVSHLPILLLTARSDAESRLAGYKSGADAYLAKPFGIELLRVCIINIFKNRSVQRALVQSATSTSPEKLTYSNIDEEFLRKVVTVIHDNLEDPEFEVNKLTAEFAMSRSSFYVKMKAILGMGANEYIRLTRVNEAAKLLKETPLNIAEISTKVGFVNPGYFSTVFKEEKGISPTKFRML